MSNLIEFIDLNHATKSSNSEDFFVPQHLHADRIQLAASVTKSFGARDTVLDVGCGYGDLHPKLVEKGLAPYNYTGIDTCESFVQEAAKRYPIGFFKTKDINDLGVMQYDHVYCLGVSGLLVNTPENFKAFLHKLIFCAKKSVVLEIQDSDIYKGKFFSSTRKEIAEMLDRTITSQNSFSVKGDSVMVIQLVLT